MSAYDYVRNPTTHDYDQIKTWNCEMKSYCEGDTVPPIEATPNNYDSYLIIMREGYAIRVENCVITFIGYLASLDDKTPIFDKWGIPYTSNTEGLMGESYFYSVDNPKDETP